MFDGISSRAGSSLSGVLTLIGLLLLMVGGALTYVPMVDPVSPQPPPRPTIPPTATPTPTPPVDDSSPPARLLLPAFEDEPTHAEATDPPPTTPAPEREGHPPTRIVIPSIGLDAPVVTTTWELVDEGGVQQAIWLVPPMRAAGWHEGSAPLGVPGNTVLNGHNTTHGEVFRDLYRVQPGDRIVLYSGSLPFVYEVDETLILPEAGQPLEVRLANARYIQPTADERVTLVTCHPYGSLRYRLIVIARPVETAPPEEIYK